MPYPATTALRALAQLPFADDEPIPSDVELSARRRLLGAERARVVAYLRREAEALDSCGLDGSAVSHLAGRIEQGAHLEDA
jgi:hypothetical protein